MYVRLLYRHDVRLTVDLTHGSCSQGYAQSLCPRSFIDLSAVFSYEQCSHDYDMTIYGSRFMWAVTARAR